MQPVIKKKRSYLAQYGALEMEKIVVGDIEAIGTCRKKRRLFTHSCEGAGNSTSSLSTS